MSFCLDVNMVIVGVADYLLGVALEHQVLLALVQPALFQCPEVKNSVLPLEQLAEDACTHVEESKHTHTRTWVSKKPTSGLLNFECSIYFSSFTL